VCSIFLIVSCQKTPATPIKIEIPEYLTLPVYERVIECDQCTENEVLLNIKTIVDNFAKCKIRHEALVDIVEKYNNGI